MYNDTYGHSEGDKCLRSVAEVFLKNITRTDDFVARYGGEEVTVVLPNTDELGAPKIADKLLDKVRSLNIPNGKSTAADFVTVSIGVTTGNVAEHTQNKEDFIRQADIALYNSKQSGRNRQTFIALE
jgi:diguanylate cyclase (GGDEF)-like protein